MTRRSDPAGHVLPEEPGTRWRRTPVPGHPGSWVWLERPEGSTGPLDGLISERAAIAVHALVGDDPTPGQEAALLTALDADASEPARQEAVRRLGLAGPTVVAAVAEGTVPGRFRVRLDGLDVVLAPAELDGARAGAATAATPAELPGAMARAQEALALTDRATGPGASALRHEDLGALASLVGRFTPAEAMAVSDVRALGALADKHQWVIDTIQAVLDQPSQRQAAALLHVHHSTVAERLVLVQRRLGYSPVAPIGRQRATVTLMLWRVGQRR